MNEFEIRDLFIMAAEIDGRLPDAPRPARLKSQSLPFVHSFADRKGWEPADMSAGLPLTKKNRFGEDIELTELQRVQIKRALKDQLEYGDRGRQDLEAQNFWEGDRITPSQVSEWEKANELMRLVSRQRHRRCLWAWAQSKAKTLRIADEEIIVTNLQPNFQKRVRPTVSSETVLKRISFSKWCRDVEDIHRNHGKMCADYAIAEIILKLASKTSLPCDKRQNGTLRIGAEIRDIRDRLDESTGRTYRSFDPMNGWVIKDKNKTRALMRFDEDLMHIDMRDESTRRRHREEKRRKAAA